MERFSDFVVHICNTRNEESGFHNERNPRALRREMDFHTGLMGAVLRGFSREPGLASCEMTFEHTSRVTGETWLSYVTVSAQ